MEQQPTETLETRVSKSPLKRALDTIAGAYNTAYQKSTYATNLTLTGLATMGGDYLSKHIIEGKPYSMRDVAVTAGASLIMAKLYPTLAEKVVPRLDKLLQVTKEQVEKKRVPLRKKIVKSLLLSLAFQPLNMTYWSALSYKNQTPITMESTREGLAANAQSFAPYVLADYFVANAAKGMKYAVPIWTATELTYNGFIALKNTQQK